MLSVLTHTARRRNRILSRFLRERALGPPVPGRVGRPAGADLVGTYAGDGKVEIYDMLRPPGTNTPSTFRGDDVCSDDVLLYVCVSANMGYLGEALFICVFGQGAQPATRDN